MVHQQNLANDRRCGKIFFLGAGRRRNFLDMKSVLVFACLVTLAVAQTSDEMFQQVTARKRTTAIECAHKLGVSEDIVDRYLVERYSKDVNPMGCLKACIMTELDLMIDGKMSLQALYDFIDDVFDPVSSEKDQLHEIQYKCTAKTRHIRNECKLGLEFYNCASEGLNSVGQ